MNETMNSKVDPRINRQLTNTEQDIRIREQLNGLLTTEWSRTAMEDLRQEIIGFYTLAFLDLGDSEGIFSKYKNLLLRLKSIAKSRILTGEPYLGEVRGSRGVIIVTNHLGMGILTIIDNTDHRFPVSLEEFVGFPVRLAALPLVAENLDVPLYETAVELPPPLFEIQKACKTIIVPVEGKDRTEQLARNVLSLVAREPGAAIVMYPEGGTSGKRNNGGPYDLDEFHRGAFVVAIQTGLPILPVCQYFNPEKGLELHVLKPILLEQRDIGRVDEIKEETRAAMQKRLDELKVG